MCMYRRVSVTEYLKCLLLTCTVYTTKLPTIPFYIQVYPTATRALGLGTSSGMARVGALITPFVAQVVIYLIHSFIIADSVPVHCIRFIVDKNPNGV